MEKFETGNLYMTAGITAKAGESPAFHLFVNKSLERYKTGDWGDTCSEDAELNDNAVTSNDRIFAVYKKTNLTIWIITEYDRLTTTVLFPSEY